MTTTDRPADVTELHPLSEALMASIVEAYQSENLGMLIWGDIPSPLRVALAAIEAAVRADATRGLATASQQHKAALDFMTDQLQQRTTEKEAAEAEVAGLRSALEAMVLEHTGFPVGGVVLRHVHCATCDYITAALAAQRAAPEPHSTTCLSRSDDVCTCKPRPAQPAAPEKPSTAPDGFYGASKDFWDALNPPAPEAEPRLTHGRHCRCTPCAREDWTRPDLAHCGMHGPSCPAVYAPFAAPCEHDWHYYDGNETEGTESICSKCRTVRDDAQPIAPDAEPERCAFRGCGMPMIDVRHDFATPDDDRLTRHTFASAAPDGRTHHVGDECPGGHR